MNKSEFVKSLSHSCNLSIDKCCEVLSKSYKLICQKLREGECVVFKGFGKFYVKEKKERFIKSFKSNDMQLLGCRNIPAFKIGKSFKSQIK